MKNEVNNSLVYVTPVITTITTTESLPIMNSGFGHESAGEDDLFGDE